MFAFGKKSPVQYIAMYLQGLAATKTVLKAWRSLWGLDLDDGARHVFAEEV